MGKAEIRCNDAADLCICENMKRRGITMKKWMKIGAFACAGVMAMSMSAFADTTADPSNTADAAKIPDGVYALPVTSDYFMLSISKLDNSQAFLTVKNGVETLTFRLSGQGYDYLYFGNSTAAEDPAHQIKTQVKRGDSHYFTLPLTEDGYAVKVGSNTLSLAGHSASKKRWYGAHTWTMTYTGNEQNLQTAKVSAPAKTAITKVKAKKKAAAVSWKQITKNGSGYQLQYSTNKSMKKASKTNLYYNDETSKTVKKLKSGKTYYFRVRTEHFNGYKSAYSGWSKVKSVKVK